MKYGMPGLQLGMGTGGNIPEVPWLLTCILVWTCDQQHPANTQTNTQKTDMKIPPSQIVTPDESNGESSKKNTPNARQHTAT